ncbi:hypothetical protein LJC20_02160 [Eubacteriales bacterium OttesenSCG-928-M02]|nr:hypothetical protein [Eubacteriales bacterium OttesenSCG-928-M02]
MIENTTNSTNSTTSARNIAAASVLSSGTPSTGKSYFASLLSASMGDSLLSGGTSSMEGLGGMDSLGMMALMGLGNGEGSTKDALLMMCMMMVMGQSPDIGTMMTLLSMVNGQGSSGLTDSNGTSAANAYYNAAKNSYNNIASTGTGKAVIPTAAYKAITPGVTSNMDNRSAALYNKVIAQFDVENTERYRPYRQGKGDTYCNIYVWDVTRAMGAEIPHYYDPKTLEAKYYPDTTGAVEMGATRMCEWLEKKGQDYGWREVTAEEAQKMANAGKPAVAVTPKHVQMVCPSKDGSYNAQKGVTVAQAGSKVTGYAYISSIYSKNRLATVRYYAHD